jgi:hypothetical protein
LKKPEKSKKAQSEVPNDKSKKPTETSDKSKSKSTTNANPLKIKFSQIEVTENSISSFDESDNEYISDKLPHDDSINLRPRGGNINRRKPLTDAKFRISNTNIIDSEDEIDEIYMKRHTDKSQIFFDDAKTIEKEVDKKIEEYDNNIEKFKIDLDLLNKHKLKAKLKPPPKIFTQLSEPINPPKEIAKKNELEKKKDVETVAAVDNSKQEEAKPRLSKSAQFDLLLKRLRFKISGGEDISQDMASLRALGEDWLLKWCIIQEHKIKEAGVIFSKYDYENRGYLIGDNLVKAISEVCELDKFKMNYLFSVLDLCGADPFKHGVDIKLFAIMIALANRIVVIGIFSSFFP